MLKTLLFSQYTLNLYQNLYTNINLLTTSSVCDVYIFRLLLQLQLIIHHILMEQMY